MNNILYALEEYGKILKEKYKTSIASEHTLRTPLENLLNAIKDKEIKIEHEAIKQEFEIGTPDFKIFKQIDSAEKLTYPNLIGYIECKKLNEDLDKILKTSQIKKYLEVSPNIILTNYNRFILLSFDKKIEDIVLFPYGLDENNLFSNQNDITQETADKLLRILNQFFDSTLRTIKSKKELVKVLSSQAFYLGVKAREYTQSNANANSKFTKYFNKTYESFKDAVNYDFGIDEFCDIFSQSIVYGLFVAHVEAKENSKRIDEIEDFISSLPNEFSLLSEFLYFSAPSFNIPLEISYAITNIKKTIVLIDQEKIAKELNTNTDGISIYLYEDFLKAYDDLRGTEKRKEGGVFYTPQPIVKFIVETVNYILKNKLGISKGFAEKNVKTLDFATGTGSFLAEVFNVILEQEKSPVFKISTIKDKFLKDIYGFEMMFVPYIVAHLKLSKILKKVGFDDFNDENRLQIYLTNTLDLEQRRLSMSMPLLMLEEEHDKAEEIKNLEEILVVLGNPPYNVNSKNKGQKIQDLLKSYTEGLGSESRWLNDDYIKFIRFSQWKLLEQKNKNLLDDKTDGIMAFITNNSFLSGKSHSKMRESLYKAFDEIYILNLHGNSDEDPANDKNVFDIKSGVCISFFIKNKNLESNKEVNYFSTLESDIFSRENKFELLQKGFNNIQWKKLTISSPDFWFTNKVFNNIEYENFISIDSIFLNFSTAISTNNDKFCIHYSEKELVELYDDCRTLKEDEIRIKYSVKEDSRDWVLSSAMQDFVHNFNPIKISYKPFDFRFTSYSTNGFIAYPRPNTSKHVIRDNLSIYFTKQVILQDNKFTHAFIGESLCDNRFMLSNKNLANIAPLYLYNKNELENTEEKVPNFTMKFKNLISSKEYSNSSPEEILSYIYAILYSPTYRDRYYEYLKIDYPKIPFTNNLDTFVKLSRIGKELIDLHLMKNIPNYEDIFLDFTSSGNSKNCSFIIKNMQSKERYKNQKIFLNDDIYISGVTEAIWNYKIGGYQVLDKWIKGSSKSGSRIDKELTREDFEHLIDICQIIKKTIELENNLRIDFDSFE